MEWKRITRRLHNAGWKTSNRKEKIGEEKVKLQSKNDVEKIQTHTQKKQQKNKKLSTSASIKSPVFVRDW